MASKHKFTTYVKNGIPENIFEYASAFYIKKYLQNVLSVFVSLIVTEMQDYPKLVAIVMILRLQYLLQKRAREWAVIFLILKKSFPLGTTNLRHSVYSKSNNLTLNQLIINTAAGCSAVSLFTRPLLCRPAFPDP